MHTPDPGQTSATQRSDVKDAIIDLIAGSAGGIANVIVGQPLDTVKVKMQTFPSLYKGGLDCFVKTYANDGIKGLYAGTVPSLVANVAENSILFAAYGGCQKVVQFAVRKDAVKDLTVLENAFSGFLAAFFSALALCPTELIKCRLQAQREMSNISGEKMAHIGPWKMTRDILKAEGIPGIYRGLTSTIVREMPGYFFFFGGYELSRELLRPPNTSKENIGLFRTIISGGVGGVALWVAIFPFDVVKSRIQIAGSKESMLSVISTIVRKEGIKPLYNGLGPTIVRTFPSTGALFVAYEYTKKALQKLTE